MINTDAKPKAHFNPLACGIFFLIGGVVLIVLYIIFKLDKTDGFVKATGVISKIEEYIEDYSPEETTVSYHVFVDYTYLGVNYTAEVNFYHIGMKVGDSIAILINPNNPMDIRAVESIKSSIWLLISGIVCMVGGSASLTYFFIKRKKKNTPAVTEQENA